MSTPTTSLSRQTPAERKARRLIQLARTAEALANVEHDGGVEQVEANSDLQVALSTVFGYGATVAEVAAALTAGAAAAEFGK